MRFFLAVFAVFILMSCRTLKKLPPVPDRNVEEIIQSLRTRNIDFKWFNAKMSTALESPDESVSGSMTVRIKRDSIVWVAVKKFGIEAARLLVDKNNYTILYRLEGVYESGNISKINDIITVTANFEDIQQLMFGNVIIPENGASDFRKDSIYYVVSTRVDGIFLEYFVNGYNLQLEKMIITDKMNRVAKAFYSDYRDVGNFGKVAYQRAFEFPYAYDKTATINMKFSEIEIDVPKEIKFSIPDSYEKIN
jgi:hypothetical protein